MVMTVPGQGGWFQSMRFPNKGIVRFDEHHAGALCGTYEHPIAGICPDWGAVQSRKTIPQESTLVHPRRMKGVTEKRRALCSRQGFGRRSIPSTERWLVWLDCNNLGMFAQDEPRSQSRPEHKGLAGHLRGGA